MSIQPFLVFVLTNLVVQDHDISRQWKSQKDPATIMILYHTLKNKPPN